MKKAIKVMFLILSLTLVVSTFAVNTFATESTYEFKGVDTSKMSEIMVDGKGTGVILHQLHTSESNFITANKKINIMEVPLNEYVTIELSNNQGVNAKTSTTLTAIQNYDAYNRVVLAGTNATWYNTTNSNLYSDSTKKMYVSWGLDVSNGEILNSPFTAAETKYIDGKYMDGPYCFAITKDNKALVGKPKVTVKLTNETKGEDFTLDGINRGPVNNSAMVYNNRFNDYTYVNSDALEFIVKVDGTNKFYFDQEMTGTVEKIIPSGSEEREPLQEGYITITVRGTVKKNKFQNYQVGDKIRIATTVKNTNGTNHADWANVKTSCGGQILIMKGGRVVDTSLSNVYNQYPTMIAGIKKDGTVVICNVTADTNNTYSGLNFCELNKFCKAVGYSDCFLLDGGGSATLLTLEDGNYVDRGCYSDGQIRSVVNSLLVVYDKGGNANAFPVATPEPTPEPTPTVVPEVTTEPKTETGCGSSLTSVWIITAGAFMVIVACKKKIKA